MARLFLFSIFDISECIIQLIIIMSGKLLGEIIPVVGSKAMGILVATTGRTKGSPPDGDSAFTVGDIVGNFVGVGVRCSIGTNSSLLWIVMYFAIHDSSVGFFTGTQQNGILWACHER